MSFSGYETLNSEWLSRLRFGDVAIHDILVIDGPLGGVPLSQIR